MKNLGLRFTYVDSTTAVIAIFTAAAVLSLLFYLRSFRGRFTWWPLFLAALRFGALTTALLLVLRPVVTYDRIHRSEGRVAVLLDGSRSMTHRDSVQGETRLASGLRIATSQSLERLGKLFAVEHYTFSGKETLASWTPLPDKSAGETGTTPAVVADGATTDLAASWKSLPSGAGPLEAIILLTDGRDHSNTFPQAGDIPPGLLPAVPVHVVGIGSGDTTLRDIRWLRIDSERKALKGNQVPVQARIQLRAPEPVTTRLVVKLEDVVIRDKAVNLKPGVNDLEWTIIPDRGGSLIYELTLEAPRDDAISENNTTHLLLNVSEQPLQVLCFEGRARWQYKFLRRVLVRDPSLNVTGIVHLGEGRQLLQGSPPIPLGDGLPGSKSEWKPFELLVLGNVIREEFAPGDLQRIAAWVAEDGGGLILSGGPESWASLAGTEVDELLPLTVVRPDRIPGDLLVSPPLEALSHPITRGLEAFFSPTRMKPFVLAEAFEAGRLRPGAELLLSVTPAREETTRNDYHTLLAARQYGKGRVLSYFTESDWRWFLERKDDGGDRLFSTLWSRMARWASRRAGSLDGDLRLRLSRDVVRSGEEVEIELAGGQDPSRIRVIARDTDGREETVPKDDTAGEPPIPSWTGRFTPTRAGVHEIRAEEDRSSMATTTLIVEPDTREMEETRPDWELLRRIARASGGRFLTLAETGTLADGIVRDSRGAVTHVELGVEQGWMLYLALVLLLSLEWVLRRRIHVV